MDPAKKQAREQKEAARKKLRAEREKTRHQKEAARKKRRAEREEVRAAKRRKHREARQVRAARRRARRLAMLLWVQSFLLWLHRLVWPEYTRRLPKSQAMVVLVLNIAPFPGLGTIVYGKWERGLVQFLLTFVFLLGWLWAITDGVRIMMRAFEPERRRVERVKRSGMQDQ